MRIRTIKPELFLDDQLADTPPWVRLLFVGLWLVADREGRLEDRPSRIKGQLFPFDPMSAGDIDQALWELHRLTKIMRYEVKGISYIEIPGFTKHQRPHMRESPSRIPHPKLPSISVELARIKAGAEHNLGDVEHARSSGDLEIWSREGKGRGCLESSVANAKSAAAGQAAPDDRSLAHGFPERWRSAYNSARSRGMDDVAARTAASEQLRSEDGRRR